MVVFPWWAKILLKLVLSKLPISYKIWSGSGLFRHGMMDNPDYAMSVFDKHISPFYSETALKGKVLLELGPGDSIATVIIANCKGAKAFLVDSGHHALCNKSFYTALSKRLGNCDLRDIFDDFDLLSSKYYLTEGIDSLRKFDDSSVDFIFSNAVLEHIRYAEFEVLISELRRIIKPCGFMSHEVDFRDHLGGSKNNLRFPNYLWESRFFSSSGFYTNRISYSHMLAIFKKSGFSVVRETRTDLSTLPKRTILHRDFNDLSDSDLKTAVANFHLRPN